MMCLALPGTTAHMVAQMGSTEKKSAFVIEQPVEVPGTVLQPGAYGIRSKGAAPASSLAGAILLEIVSTDESQVYATITSIPEFRPPVPDKPTFSFYQSAADEPSSHGGRHRIGTRTRNHAFIPPSRH
jgi:hypothetical protein